MHLCVGCWKSRVAVCLILHGPSHVLFVSTLHCPSGNARGWRREHATWVSLSLSDVQSRLRKNRRFVLLGVPTAPMGAGIWPAEVVISGMCIQRELMRDASETLL